MRVIAGSARGRPLKGPRGTSTRPTSDKVKGAIFSMVESLLISIEYPRADVEGYPVPDEVDLDGGESDVEGVWSGRRVLDLYAGTGALGIEALSRGALLADFVDASPECQRLIAENLRLTGLAPSARIVRATAQHTVTKAADLGLRGPFDIALADPPYGDPSTELVLAGLGAGDLLARGALVIVEHSRRGVPSDSYTGLTLVKRRRHGDTEVSIYLRR